MAAHAPQLRRLAFGNRGKMHSRSLQRMQYQVERVFGWNAEYDAIGDASAFAIQQSFSVINGLKLVCMSHTPIRTRVETDEFSFFMPMDGGPIHSKVNGKEILCNVATDALLAPEGERVGEGNNRSVLVASIDRRRLLHTARTMLGQDEIKLDLGNPTVLPLNVGGVNFDLMVRSACNLLEACNLSGELAAKIGVDETFYRAICGMLLRDQLFGEGEGKAARTLEDEWVERACDYVLANLSRRITLTDLEMVSGLSARSLQYGFQRHFGCSPVTWIRNERLNAARDLLLAKGAETNVTTAALTFGFSNLGTFSKLYREKFGEYPTATLAASRARRG
ncbi:helix-turn-helix domain-containing protein [Roseixanthobacter glucoisosaccharinicivorans]|uniref:helix-turn-helix domain-containing protein n=1 Tax=Roseixanthobacter glucoisosaccharinicivorans TaxID=3119923 RepID=UPI00372AC13D